MRTPVLTINRYIGSPCSKCGNRVRMKKKAACVVCLRRKAEAWMKRVGYRKRPHMVAAKNARSRRQHLAIKRATIDAYGGKCSCCGEKEICFLTIDHEVPVLRKTRGYTAMKTGSDTYRKLRAQSYPKGFRVLCFNCNCGRQVNGGVCPHKVVL